MIKIIVDDSNKGQRLNKFCKRILVTAPDSFIYKMLRKKNIKLNGKKAAGDEIVNAGDEVDFFLSDATFKSFSEAEIDDKKVYLANSTAVEHNKITLDKNAIVYEDENILVCHKNRGELSQKADPKDISINERIVSYLTAKASTKKSEEPSAVFVPGVCNRLDRNTEGLVIAGKTPFAQAEISRILKDHSLEKYYLALVVGRFDQTRNFRLYMSKDEKNNKVSVSETEKEGYAFTETVVSPLRCGSRFSLLKIRLMTGKTHQIRAALSHLGHPIAGDPKYGDFKVNADLAKKGIKSQLLMAYELRFPADYDKLPNLAGVSINDTKPSWYDFELN